MAKKPLQQLPIGLAGFPSLRATDQLYVDKTEMVYRLASKKSGMYFLARPRRFGKSLLVSTFESLFKYGLRDFKGLAIEKLWKDDRKYSVVALDFSRVKGFLTVDQFKEKLDEYLIGRITTLGLKSPLETSIKGLQAFTLWLDVQPTNSVVLLIDEYDAPLTACIDNEDLFNEVRAVLVNFYSALKNDGDSLRFLFMTGITKFNKTNIFSALNNLDDISLDSTYAALLGYTVEELEYYFDGYLEQAEKALGLTREELLRELVSYYDGFCFDRTAKSRVFTPWSILNFFSKPQEGFNDYWFESGGKPTVITEYFKSHALKKPSDLLSLKKISKLDLAASSDVDVIDDTVLLTQAGYLTIKNVDVNAFYVGYPNREVFRAMLNLYSELLLKGKTMEQLGYPNVADQMANGTPETIVQLLNDMIHSIGYHFFKNTVEADIQGLICAFLAGSGLEVETEVYSAAGRSDIEVSAKKRRLVFELKLQREGESAVTKLREAVRQIEKRNYGRRSHGMELMRIALVFSEQDRKFVKYEVVN